MTVKVLMPALSRAMEEGTLVRWLVREGDAVRPGDVIAEIETDKTSMEIEAEDAGVVARLLVPAGTRRVRVNTPIAELSGSAADAPGRPLPHAVAHMRLDPEPPGLAVRDALREALAAGMRADPDVVLFGEGIAAGGPYRVTQGLAEEFGRRRVVDVPPALQGVAGLAVGAAFAGLRPVVEVPSFAHAVQALAGIVQAAALTPAATGGALACPIVFRGPSGASAQLGPQLSQDLAGWLAHVPGLTVVAPWSSEDAGALLRAAIRDPGPVIFLESELLYGRSFPADPAAPPAELGRARVRRPGKDITLASFGTGMTQAMGAAEMLAAEGISAEVLDLLTLRPLDAETLLASVRRTTRCLVVEEGWPQGAVGEHVAALLMREAFDDLAAPVLSLTGADTALPYAAGLERAALPSAAQVAEAARKLVAR